MTDKIAAGATLADLPSMVGGKVATRRWNRLRWFIWIWGFQIFGQWREHAYCFGMTRH